MEMATTTTQHGRLLWALITGTAVLFMVLGYGLVLRPQAPATKAPAAESTFSERQPGIDTPMQDEDPAAPRTANIPDTAPLATDLDDTTFDAEAFTTTDSDAQ